MGSGGLRGLQILLSGVSDVRGGFDSHTFPPRLRGGRLAAVLLLLLLPAAFMGPLPAPRAAAQPPSRGGSPADSAARAARPRTAPYKVMLRSAAVPGWGQLHNGQPLKAALVVGGEGFLIASAFRELHRQNDALERVAERTALGDSAGAVLAELEADAHRDRKITWIWWGIAAHLLSMADAYVDAHLSTFDADFGRAEARPGPVLPGERIVRLAVGIRF